MTNPSAMRHYRYRMATRLICLMMLIILLQTSVMAASPPGSSSAEPLLLGPRDATERVFVGHAFGQRFSVVNKQVDVGRATYFIDDQGEQMISPGYSTNPFAASNSSLEGVIHVATSATTVNSHAQLKLHTSWDGGLTWSRTGLSVHSGFPLGMLAHGEYVEVIYNDHANLRRVVWETDLENQSLTLIIDEPLVDQGINQTSTMDYIKYGYSNGFPVIAIAQDNLLKIWYSSRPEPGVYPRWEYADGNVETVVFLNPGTPISFDFMVNRGENFIFNNLYEGHSYVTYARRDQDSGTFDYVEPVLYESETFIASAQFESLDDNGREISSVLTASNNGIDRYNRQAVGPNFEWHSQSTLWLSTYHYRPFLWTSIDSGSTSFIGVSPSQEYYLVDSEPPPFDNCLDATAGRALMLITGWGGSVGETMYTDWQLKHLLPALAGDGYIPGCNLFYAEGTSPEYFQSQNAQVIHEQMCAANLTMHELRQQGLIDWDGRFDILAHSYGGLRSRAYLESLYSPSCHGHPLEVENLLTLGSPHDGQLPTTPLGPLIGINLLRGKDRPAAIEMMPTNRKHYNKHAIQPADVCYHLLGGDATGWVPGPGALPLDYVIAPYLDSSTPNDGAVNVASALALDNPAYPGFHTVDTVINSDFHGYLDGLLTIPNYMKSAATYASFISPRLGSICSPIVQISEPAKQAESGQVTLEQHSSSASSGWLSWPVNSSYGTNDFVISDHPESILLEVQSPDFLTFIPEAIAYHIGTPDERTFDFDDPQIAPGITAYPLDHGVLVHLEPNLMTINPEGVWTITYRYTATPDESFSYQTKVHYSGEGSGLNIVMPQSAQAGDLVRIDAILDPNVKNELSDPTSLQATLLIQDANYQLVAEVPMSQLSTDHWQADWYIPEAMTDLVWVDVKISSDLYFTNANAVRSNNGAAIVVNPRKTASFVSVRDASPREGIAVSYRTLDTTENQVADALAFDFLWFKGGPESTYSLQAELQTIDGLVLARTSGGEVIPGGGKDGDDILRLVFDGEHLAAHEGPVVLSNVRLHQTDGQLPFTVDFRDGAVLQTEPFKANTFE